MAIASVLEVRRSLLRGALSLIGLAAAAAGEARAQSRPRRTRDEILFEQVSAFLEQYFDQHGDLVVGPVSLLQRQFGLGYGEALNLADKLEEAHVWAVFRDGCGVRCARKVSERYVD